MNKSIIFTALFFLLSSMIAFAQPPKGMPSGMGGMNMNIGKVFGKVLDKNTKKPLPYTSIAIYQTFGKKDSLINGNLSAENGDFSVEGLPVTELKVKVSFLGYKDNTQKVKLSIPDNLEVDLGNISLEDSVISGNEVNITTEKSQVAIGIDKRVYNVSKNLTATGGTAEDVLKSVPSVTLDSDGNAQLRNAAATVYVDGRPSQLTLNQIPADMIEQVEVMTNPSAKYEAGMTGGMVNIVLKKNKKPGYNGFIALGAGTGNRYNVTANLNLHKGKWNTTIFYNRNTSGFHFDSYTHRTNYDSLGNILSYYDQTSVSSFKNKMQIARLSIDYALNNRNTLSLAGNLIDGAFNVGDAQGFTFLDNNKAITKTGNMWITPDNGWRNYSLQGTWKKKFPKQGREWTSDVTYNWGGSHNVSNWQTSMYQTDTTTVKNKISGGSDGYQLTFQSDFINPINDSTRLEFGVRSYWEQRNQSSIFNLIGYDNSLTQVDVLSQDLKINTAINAAYINYSSKWRKIGYQVGLRYEQTNFGGTSILPMDTTFGYYYPNYSAKKFKDIDIWKGFFPAIYLSRKFNATTEFQVNATRKIGRPGFMQILPVVFMADAQNVRTGNPQIQPEFINTLEANYSKLWGSSNWVSSLYFRLDENPIVNFVEQKADGRLWSTFKNGKDVGRVGWDNTFKTTLGKSLEVTANVNVARLRLRTDVVDTAGWVGNGKLILNYKFPDAMAIKIGGKPMIKWSAQFTGNYESRQIIPQGYRKAIPVMDFAIKAEAFKVASLVFSVNDITNTRRMIWVYDMPTYDQELMRRRDTRYFKVALQIPFGKMDASVFKMGKNMQKMQQNQGGGGMDGY
jgi:hypothetical protein